MFCHCFKNVVLGCIYTNLCFLNEIRIPYSFICRHKNIVCMSVLTNLILCLILFMLTISTCHAAKEIGHPTEMENLTELQSTVSLDANLERKKFLDFYNKRSKNSHILVSGEILNEENKLSNRNLCVLAVSTPLIVSFATSNTLAFISRPGITSVEIFKGIAKFLAAQASVGVMFGTSYVSVMTDIINRKSKDGESGCKKSYIIIPAFALGASLTDALNDRLGVWNILSPDKASDMLSQIISGTVGFGNLVSEAFLYFTGGKTLLAMYKLFLGNVTNKQLPDVDDMSDIFRQIKEEGERSKNHKITSDQQENIYNVGNNDPLLNYLSEVKNSASKYVQFAKLKKAFREGRLNEQFEQEVLYDKYKARAHLVTTSFSLLFISVYLSLGMTSPLVGSGIIEHGLNNVTLMANSTLWSQVVSNYDTSPAGIYGILGIISYFIQSISLTPLSLNLFNSAILTPLSLLYMRVIDKESFLNYWEVMKESLPLGWRSISSFILSVVGVSGYLWMYSGIGAHISTISSLLHNAAKAAVVPITAFPYCIPKIKLISSVLLGSILYSASYESWKKIFSYFRYNRCCRSKGNERGLKNGRKNEVTYL